MANEAVDLIKQVPLFADLDGRELKAVAGSFKERVFPAGSVVVEEGQTGAGFFLIRSGTARVSVGGRDVRTLRAGDHFGEIALLAETPRTATVTAETDLDCAGITVWEFRSVVESNATIAWKLLQALARQIASAV